MDPFIFVSVLLSFCLQTISFSDAFSPHPFTYTATPYAHGGLAAANDDDASTKERKPWEFLRFVSQSSKFVTPPSLPFIGGGKKGTSRKISPGMLYLESVGSCF